MQSSVSPGAPSGVCQPDADAPGCDRTHCHPMGPSPAGELALLLFLVLLLGRDDDPLLHLHRMEGAEEAVGAGPVELLGEGAAAVQVVRADPERAVGGGDVVELRAVELPGEPRALLHPQIRSAEEAVA